SCGLEARDGPRAREAAPETLVRAPQSAFQWPTLFAEICPGMSTARIASRMKKHLTRPERSAERVSLLRGAGAYAQSPPAEQVCPLAEARIHPIVVWPTRDVVGYEAIPSSAFRARDLISAAGPPRPDLLFLVLTTAALQDPGL